MDRYVYSRYIQVYAYLCEIDDALNELKAELESLSHGRRSRHSLPGIE